MSRTILEMGVLNWEVHYIIEYMLLLMDRGILRFLYNVFKQQIIFSHCLCIVLDSFFTIHIDVYIDFNVSADFVCVHLCS